MKKFVITMAALMVLVATHFGCSKTAVTPADSLSAIEKQSLAFMREEEKMAYDVYVKMCSNWGLMPFQNIQQSEASHMAAVKTQLDKYNLPDPAAGKAAGEFTNSTIQQLYAMLIAKGDSSEIQALTAGCIIEEVDIRDLKEQLLQVSNEGIRNVYDNLMRGSRNHLRVFVSNLAARGVIYVPQYLSVSEYEEIINSPMERGSRSGW